MSIKPYNIPFTSTFSPTLPPLFPSLFPFSSLALITCIVFYFLNLVSADHCCRSLSTFKENACATFKEIACVTFEENACVTIKKNEYPQKSYNLITTLQIPNINHVQKLDSSPDCIARYVAMAMPRLLYT